MVAKSEFYRHSYSYCVKVVAASSQVSVTCIYTDKN